MKARITLFFSMILIVSGALAQKTQTIEFKNPSFEDVPQMSKVARGWINCGFFGQSPPDILDGKSERLNIRTLPQDGQTYVNLVTRSNHTWERIGHKLEKRLMKNKSYAFSIYLSRSEEFMSLTHSGNEEAMYTPVIFRLWGGRSPCELGELLAFTKPVHNTNWEQFEFILHPSRHYKYIILEAYYDPEKEHEPYNGNLLLDNCSAIDRVY